MRLAFTRAVPARPDYLLWLNDDVVLDDDALERLLATHAALCAERQPLSLVVGATRDPQSGTTTYGGLRRISRFRRMAFAQVEPTRRTSALRHYEWQRGPDSQIDIFDPWECRCNVHSHDG